MTEFLDDRKKALEEQFFDRHNRELIEKLRHKQARERLTEASGIEDPAVLDRMLELNVDHETFAALTLVPLVEVAWADGKMDVEERQATLKAAAEAGIREGAPAYDLLARYLEERPPLELLRTWKAYVAELCAGMPAAERDALRDDILSRARAVAAAAGGFAGLGKVSSQEQTILNELAATFAE